MHKVTRRKGEVQLHSFLLQSSVVVTDVMKTLPAVLHNYFPVCNLQISNMENIFHIQASPDSALALMSVITDTKFLLC